MLAAVDSVPPDAAIDPGPSPAAGRGVSVGPRVYDYGPGGNFGGAATVQRHERAILTLAYDAHHLYVLDGVRANHLLQRAQADIRVPLRGRLGQNVISEYFDRRTFYQDTTLLDAEFHFPQISRGDVEHQVNWQKGTRILRIAAVLTLVLALSAADSAAQTKEDTRRDSRAWLALGGGSTTVLGDCTGCAPGTYIHTGSATAGGGVSLKSSCRRRW